MASFKLHIARIRNCPPARKIASAMKEFGLPASEEFGVMSHSATEQSVFATIVRKTQQSVQRLDAASGELTASQVEKAVVYPLGVKPDSEVLEVYAGSAAALEQVGTFFASCLSLPTVVEAIELDIPAAIKKLSQTAQKFQLRSLRVREYSHNAYMTGPYAPKFMDTAHGLEFLEEYSELLASAAVKFATHAGRASVTLTPTASFSFSCAEEDQPAVQTILRKLV